MFHIPLHLDPIYMAHKACGFIQNRISNLSSDLQPNQRIWADKLMKTAQRVGNLYLTLSLIDQGVANILALETLRHGTGLLSYLSISLMGADPKRGGTMEASYFSNTHSEQILKAACKNYFYLMPDEKLSALSASGLLNHLTRVSATAKFVGMGNSTMLQLSKESFKSEGPLIGLLRYYLNKDFDPKSLMMGLLQASLGIEASLELTVKKIVQLTCCALLPVLKFRFKPEEVYANPIQKTRLAPRFEKDPLWKIAIRTAHSISPLRLGICGSLMQGIGPGMIERMRQNPTKVLTGLAFLGLAAYKGRQLYRDIKSNEEEQSFDKIDYLFFGLQKIDKYCGFIFNPINYLFKSTVKFCVPYSGDLINSLDKMEEIFRYFSFKTTLARLP